MTLHKGMFRKLKVPYTCYRKPPGSSAVYFDIHGNKTALLSLF